MMAAAGKIPMATTPAEERLMVRQRAPVSSKKIIMPLIPQLCIFVKYSRDSYAVVYLILP
jgi:hypothetical protein